MKPVLLFLLLCPLLSAAQYKSRFANDTLYTSCGFKIYPGQTLKFGKASSAQGFRYVTIMNGVAIRSLENNSFVVKDLSQYGHSIFGFATIEITGSIAFRDGSKGTISINTAFDQAIGSRLPGTTSELILPEEFQINREKAAALYMPAFENDTLYTSCGYPIYKGQLLQFGKAMGDRGKFKYVNIKNRFPPSSLQDNQVRVTKLKEFGISVFGNGYITIIGTVIVNNTEKGDIEIHLAFDHAIGHVPAIPGELLVPEEFRSRIKPGPEPEVEDQ